LDLEGDIDIVLMSSNARDIAVFIFDNSGGHACKAKDALVKNNL